MVNIWDKLHPLVEGEMPCDLADYNSSQAKEDIIVPFKEGLKEAQSLLRILNMAPSTIARLKQWFHIPWVLEKSDTKSFAYMPLGAPIAGKDGDSEVLRVASKAANVEPIKEEVLRAS